MTGARQQALVRRLKREVARTGREVNALGKGVHTAAAPLMYDVIAPDTERDAGAESRWINEGDEGLAVHHRLLPVGPAKQPASDGSMERLTDYFAELFADASMRGREEGEEGAEED